jgi:hypothetical protein
MTSQPALFSTFHEQPLDLPGMFNTSAIAAALLRAGTSDGATDAFALDMLSKKPMLVPDADLLRLLRTPYTEPSSGSLLSLSARIAIATIHVLQGERQLRPIQVSLADHAYRSQLMGVVLDACLDVERVWWHPWCVTDIKQAARSGCEGGTRPWRRRSV